VYEGIRRNTSWSIALCNKLGLDTNWKKRSDNLTWDQITTSLTRFNTTVPNGDLILKIASISRVEIIPEVLCAWRSVETSQTYAPESVVVRARDEYQLMRKIRLFHALNKADRLANFKQIQITRFLFAKALAHSGKWVKALKVVALG
jgi:hypothetical protein